jgi:hypothetical protein
MCQGDEKRTVQARMQRNNPSKVSTSSEVMRGIRENSNVKAATTETIEIDSDDEEIRNVGHATKPTLYHLKNADFNSIQHKNGLLRGTCVQAIIELLHEEKSRVELTCVSTDFYSFLMQNKMKEAKYLLHPEDEKHRTGKNKEWITPDSRIATAQSNILLIPCHANMITGEQHWFLTIRIKLADDKHIILILDSLGKASGEAYWPSLRRGLKRLQLITNKDRCIVLDTKGQSEKECGIRMTAYMVLFRSINTSDKGEKTVARLKRYTARERTFLGDLAVQRRSDMFRIIKNEQDRIKI